jgi:hypothetical protein
MNRAITFCAIALGIPAVTCAVITMLPILTSAPVSAPAAAESSPAPTPESESINGLECWTRDEGNPHSARSTKTATYMVEWLSDNKFRVPDLNNSYPYIGKDYIGTVTVTDTAYTFGAKKPTSGGSLDMWFDNREGVFSGLVVNRLNGIFEPPLEYVTKYNEKHTVTGYCKSAHVPGPPVYKKI